MGQKPWIKIWRENSNFSTHCPWKMLFNQMGSFFEGMKFTKRENSVDVSYCDEFWARAHSLLVLRHISALEKLSRYCHRVQENERARAESFFNECSSIHFTTSKIYTLFDFANFLSHFANSFFYYMQIFYAYFCPQ